MSDFANEYMRNLLVENRFHAHSALIDACKQVAALTSQVDALTARIAELEADRDILAGVLRGKDKEVKNLLSVLTDMVYQHCYEDKETGEYESGAISTDADAMEILAQHGRFEITNGWGRMIFGKFVEPPQKDGDE